MCRRVTCRKCGKPSWAGCGAHVEMVLGDVPRGERCRCHEAPMRAAGKATTKAAAHAEPVSALDKLKVWLRQ